MVVEAVEEQVATVDIIRAREQKEFPADYGQKSLVPITALGETFLPREKDDADEQTQTTPRFSTSLPSTGCSPRCLRM